MRLTISLLLVAMAAMRVSCETADAYADTIVQTHNDYRRQQGSTNICKLTWSDTLAAEANAWVSNCYFAHENNGRGENLAINTASDVATVIDTAMTSWYNEIDDYTYQMGSGGAGHYTQMIWHNTQEIGCAMQQCTPAIMPQADGTNSTWASALFFACWYDPQGNYGNQYPYLPGTACSGCMQGQTCEDSLCTGTGCADMDGFPCAEYDGWGACGIYPAFMLDYCSLTCGFC